MIFFILFICITSQDDIADPVHIAVLKAVIKRKGKDMSCRIFGCRSMYILKSAFIAREILGERIKVSSGMDPLSFQTRIDLLSSCSEFFFIKQHRKICEILPDIFLGRKEM